ncbi:MAG TPA: DUF4412 domain-containing protein [Capsulimonadaceae bacterium]|nr:DUF4412 domain-containing protein [Capsulimonadaceae bacterium]
MKVLTRFRKLAAIAVIAISTCAGLAATPARADLTFLIHMDIQSPMFQNMPADARAQMNSLMQMTMFLNGQKMRVNTAVVSVLVDQQAKTLTMINDKAKSYSVSPYDPIVAQQMMQGPGGMFSGAGSDYKVVDTGKTTTFLGHKVKHFVVTAHLSSPNTGDMTIHSDILAAQDLPPADMAAYNSMTAAAASGKAHVEGIPLKTVTTVTGGTMGTMTVTQTVTSISTKPIPANLFAIPTGYTRTTQPMVQPGMPGAPGATPPGSAPSQ